MVPGNLGSSKRTPHISSPLVSELQKPLGVTGYKTHSVTQFAKARVQLPFRGPYSHALLASNS